MRFMPFIMLTATYKYLLLEFELAAARYDAAAHTSNENSLEKAMLSAFDSINECAAEIGRRQVEGLQALQRVEILAHIAELRNDPLGEPPLC